MNYRIQQWISLFFDNLPYSDEAAQARIKIAEELEKKAGDSSIDELARDYGTYEKLAEIGGYSKEEAMLWQNQESLRDGKEIDKEIRAQKRRIYLLSGLSAFLLSEMIWTIYDAIAGVKEVFYSLGLSLFAIVLILYLLWKINRVEKEHQNDRYSVESFIMLRNKADQQTKYLLNSIALFFGFLAFFIGSQLSFYFYGNSKSAELFENITNNLIFIQVPLFLVINDTMVVRMFKNRIGFPNQKRLRRHAAGITIFSLIYWIVVSAIIIVMREFIVYPANAFLIGSIIYALLILIYDLTLRKRVTYRNFSINKKRLALVSIAALLVGGILYMSRDTYYTQPYINTVPVVEHGLDSIEYNEKTGTYTIISNDEDFKILHLTDIHLGGSLFSYLEDHQALEACYKLIENTHPDLVIVTGDLCFPLGIMSLSFNNSGPIYQFAAFMRNVGIPWAFTYGNHDTESMASLNQEELDSVFQSLSFKTSGTLLYPYIQPDVTGRNNQLIELRNADGSLNTGLFLIDSNAYTGEGINVYDFVHDDQVNWYASEVERMSQEAESTVPSMLFFHIPLQQYRTAYELYEKGSDEVTYFFGENNETAIDKICCSDYPSKLFDTAREIGGEAMFCGHDHYNNMSLEYQGIRLTYGMSIDYLVMPGIGKDTEQRGGELITIHQDRSWDLRQIPLVSLSD